MGWMVVGLTFENGVHRLPVELTSHPDEEQFLRSLGKIVNHQLLVGGNWFDDFINRLPFDLGADYVHLGSVGFRNPQEANPVAVTHSPAVGGGDFVVQPKAVANLRRGKEKI